MIATIDHIVLTTADLKKCVDFYTRALGMQLEKFGEGRLALKFGTHKINLHEVGHEFEPKATLAKPGTLDICFLAEGPLDAVIQALRAHKVEIFLGPVPRTGAQFTLRSIYVRDPDGNLIEIAEQTAQY
jgi:catechol 2,3-dioxygenase-like lactoylglutathione lyase family enzyme